MEGNGFALVRQSGSHKVFKDAAGRRTTVPFHGTEILHPKTLKSILGDVGLSVEEFEHALRDR
ncbi:MAG: type II toxin-antitoxin system HicA family toxin [Fimbriimonas ginsengisoli]|nr:type II toxin-antitoxin system HicA family toxin [Fimbriimonas ginsengisoli]